MGRDGSNTHPVRVEELKRLMDEQNISKAELSRRTGINPRQIRNILQRKSNPREDTITKIAAALGVKWRTLLEGVHAPAEQMAEVGGMEVKTRMDIILYVPNGTLPAEFKKLLIDKLSKLSDRHIEASDVISVTRVRDDDKA